MYTIDKNSGMKHQKLVTVPQKKESEGSDR